MSQFWLEITVGGLMIFVGLLALFVIVPLESRWLVSTDYANKSGYLLIIIGSLTLFFVVSGSIAFKIGLINWDITNGILF